MKLQAALSVCVEAHGNQIDRDGLPHSFHCIRVGMSQETERRMCIAFLHDILEDCPDWTYDRLETAFGMEIAYPVKLLTRPDGQTWKNYMQQITGQNEMLNYRLLHKMAETKGMMLMKRRAHEDAMYVKLADIEDNVSPRRLDDKMRRQLTMYHEGYKYIAGILGYTEKVLPLI